MKFIMLVIWVAFGLVVALADQDFLANTDSVGTELSQSYVWSKDRTVYDQSQLVGFRRSFIPASVPVPARGHRFAYPRYQLFDNGEFVGRGPNRFEDRRPEYHTRDSAALPFYWEDATATYLYSAFISCCLGLAQSQI